MYFSCLSSVCVQFTDHCHRVETQLRLINMIKGKDNGKGKGKALPITGHEGPEGEQMYSSTLPLTSAQDGGGWSAPSPGRFTPGKDPVPFV